jgi:hypothetical protein
MSIEFTENAEIIDWERLAGVFKRTPLGHRHPAKLKEAFQNSQNRCNPEAQQKIGLIV